MEPWIIKAIEDAAMERTLRMLDGASLVELLDKRFRLFGLTKDQILALMQFYQEKTGQAAETIQLEPLNGS